MNWTVGYRIERVAVLDEIEQAGLASWRSHGFPLELVEASPVRATGNVTLPLDFAHDDPPRLLVALTELRALVPGAGCVIDDNLGLIGWAPRAARYELNAGYSEDAVLEARIRGLIGARDAYEQRKALAELDPLEVARAALAVLPTTPNASDVKSVLGAALERLGPNGLAPLESELAALWNEPKRHDRWWPDIVNALDRVAPARPIMGRAIEVLLDGSPDFERRRSAIWLLERALRTTPEVIRPLIQRLHRDRGTPRTDARWRTDAIAALAKCRRPELMPVLVLELAAPAHAGWMETTQSLARLAGDAALPWLRRVFDCSGAARSVIRALRDVPAALDWLRELARDPDPTYRATAADELGARGPDELPLVAAVWKTLDAIGYDDLFQRKDALALFGLPRDTQAVDWDALIRARGATPVEVPPIGDILAHAAVYDDRRVHSLQQIYRKPDPAYLVAMVLGCEIESALRRRGYNYGLPSWKAWATVVPQWPFGDATKHDPAMPEWIRAHRNELPPQRMTPALERVFVHGPEEIVAAAPEPGFVLEPAERESLEAAERALLA